MTDLVTGLKDKFLLTLQTGDGRDRDYINNTGTRITDTLHIWGKNTQNINYK